MKAIGWVRAKFSRFGSVVRSRDRERGAVELGVAALGGILVVGAVAGNGVASTITSVSDGSTWVADGTTGQIVQLDPRTGRVDRRLQVGPDGTALDIEQRAGHLVLTGSNGRVTSIDLTALVASGQREVGANDNVRVLVGQGKLFLADLTNGVIRTVHPLTLADLGAPYRSRDLTDAVTDGAGKVWLVDGAAIKTVRWDEEARRFVVEQTRKVRGVGPMTRLTPHERGVSAFVGDAGAVVQLGTGRDLAVGMRVLRGKVLAAEVAPADLAPASVPEAGRVVMISGRSVWAVAVKDVGCARPGMPSVFANRVYVPCLGDRRVIALDRAGKRVGSDLLVGGSGDPRLLVDEDHLIIQSGDRTSTVVVNRDGSSRTVDVAGQGGEPRNAHRKPTPSHGQWSSPPARDPGRLDGRESPKPGVTTTPPQQSPSAKPSGATPTGKPSTRRPTERPTEDPTGTPTGTPTGGTPTGTPTASPTPTVSRTGIGVTMPPPPTMEPPPTPGPSKTMEPPPTPGPSRTMEPPPTPGPSRTMEPPPTTPPGTPPPPPPPPPPAPQPAVTGVVARATGKTSIEVTWTPAGAPQAIEVRSSDGVSATVPGTADRATLTGVQCGALLTVDVVSVFPDGTRVPAAQATTSTPRCGPAPVTGLAVRVSTEGGGLGGDWQGGPGISSARLTWTPAPTPVDYYIVRRVDGVSKTADNGASEHVLHERLPDDQDWVWQVISVVGDEQAVASVRPPLPGPVTGLTIERGFGVVGAGYSVLFRPPGDAGAGGIKGYWLYCEPSAARGGEWVNAGWLKAAPDGRSMWTTSCTDAPDANANPDTIGVVAQNTEGGKGPLVRAPVPRPGAGGPAAADVAAKAPGIEVARAPWTPPQVENPSLLGAGVALILPVAAVRGGRAIRRLRTRRGRTRGTPTQPARTGQVAA